MASLAQERNGNYRIVFWFGGTRFKRSLKTSNVKKAHDSKARLEDTLQMVEMGRPEVPEDADVAAFFLTDGKQGNKPHGCKAIRQQNWRRKPYRIGASIAANRKPTRRAENART